MSEFLLKPRICFGQDALSVLNELSARSVLLVTDQAMVKFGLAERVTALLRQRGIAWQMWDDVVADPDIATVVRGMKLMDNHYPDLVIALGGGSVIDAAKAVIFSLAQTRPQANRPRPCFVAIPTTSGTGSEVTSACVISDPEKGIKYPLFHEALCPDMAIIDPTLVVSVPPTITAHTGLDALTHALEAWVSPQATDFTDALAEKAARLVFRALPVAIRQGDCIATRSKMHNASTLAGMAFSQAGLGLNHAIAHQLGGQFHLPHGLANALLLTAVIRFNAGEPRAAKRYARLARACRFCPPAAGEQEAFQALLTAVETLKQQCAIPPLKGALQEKYPLFLSRIPAMVPAALADATLRTNPRPVDGAAIAQLLENLQ